MTTEEIANEVLNAWYHENTSHQPYEHTDAKGFKKVCEVIERVSGLVEFGPNTNSASQTVVCSPATMPPNDLIRLLRERLLTCSRGILTPMEGRPINYKRMSEYLAAMQAVDDLEKMPAIVDASIPF